MAGRRPPLLILALAALLAMPLAAPSEVRAALPPGGTFMDDNGSMFEGAIEAVAAEGITKGCDPPLNDLFCPNDPVTRGQMAAFLVRALGLTATSGATFSDVPSTHTFATDIDRLATAGITSGCGSGRFCPNDPVTRGQMAAFLQRALELTPIVPPPTAVGNPTGNVPIPAAARAVDTSDPDRVIGNGTPGSCTSAAVVSAVAQGGIITFDCGPDPVTIAMSATARVFNDKPNVVLDGGGLVTLDGGGARRILYMNTCDPALVWTTSHCHDQDHPTLTVQDIAFVNGRASGTETMDGGGAIFVRGGRFKVVRSEFYGNRCASTGPDVGGAAIQVFSQYRGRPVYVVNSTFGGPGALRNECSNGGAISSIGVSWTILNSRFSDNRAVGSGANPPKPGTPGGGNGGAIYNDGNTMTLRVHGTRIEDNQSNGEGGSAIFFVSNDRSGSVEVVESVLRDNTGDGFSTHPGIFFLGRRITFIDSIVE